MNDATDDAKAEAASHHAGPESEVRFRPGGRMLEALVCPLTHGLLEYDRDARELISRKAGLAYPIRDGIPIMLESEARRLEDK